MSALPESFVPAGRLRFERMNADNIDSVLAIETAVFPFPWSRQVFAGTISEGHDCWVARDETHAVVGYFVLMKVVDEAHLLTIGVRRDLHGRGIGRALLDRVIAVCREMPVESLLLEVRPSNTRALDMYARYGFEEIGRRKHYYPGPEGTREDAIVMRLPL